jgi:DNA-binding transcriptional ArsR family regulator
MRSQAARRPVDHVFHALAHPARVRVVERLGRGPASVSELAGPAQMSLPAFMQHLRVLEQAGVVRSDKAGRVRTYHLELAPLAEASGWLAEQRSLWERRLDQLDAYVRSMKELDDEG